MNRTAAVEIGFELVVSKSVHSVALSRFILLLCLSLNDMRSISGSGTLTVCSSDSSVWWTRVVFEMRFDETSIKQTRKPSRRAILQRENTEPTMENTSMPSYTE